MSGMHLSPLPHRRLMATKKKSVTWSDVQRETISELIYEASALLDAFDQMSSMLLIQPVPNNKSKPKCDFVDYQLPAPSKWNPILTEHCQSLALELAKFKPHKFQC